MTFWLAAQDDLAGASAAIRRFGTLIQATPSLHGHQSDLMDQFITIAAASLAERAATSADDPKLQIAATALLGLWHIQFHALWKYLDGTRTPGQVHEAVTADVQRTAHLIQIGLSSFASLNRAPTAARPPAVEVRVGDPFPRWRRTAFTCCVPCPGISPALARERNAQADASSQRCRRPVAFHLGEVDTDLRRSSQSITWPPSIAP
jgi:hypothetical protein